MRSFGRLLTLLCLACSGFAAAEGADRVFAIDSAASDLHWLVYKAGALARLGLLADRRTDDAMQLLASKRRADGTWRTGGRRYWTPATEVADWGDAHQIVTAAALAVLQ